MPWSFGLDILCIVTIELTVQRFWQLSYLPQIIIIWRVKKCFCFCCIMYGVHIYHSLGLASHWQDKYFFGNCFEKNWIYIYIYSQFNIILLCFHENSFQQINYDYYICIYRFFYRQFWLLFNFKCMKANVGHDMKWNEMKGNMWGFFNISVPTFWLQLCYLWIQVRYLLYSLDVWNSALWPVLYTFCVFAFYT
jgi:hypothetical protein